MEETSGAKLAHGGVKELTDTLKKLDKGGLLFIDEAYQLKPSTNRSGAEVLDFLLPEIENQRGKLVVVLAGYQKQMEELIAYNEGLPSRFPRVFNFVDYNEAELLEILKGIVDSAKPRFTVADPKFLRIAARRLAAMRGTPGFGNARAARNLYEQSRARQAARVQRLNEAGTLPQDPQERKRAMLQLERDDLLGPRELDLTTSTPLRELEGMVGLEGIKAEVRNLLELVKTNAELEEGEKPTRKVNLNRLFLGNPGTGA
jgi:SpoVK/Ycf46/Vps4 family AAA+-type ATPase